MHSTVVFGWHLDGASYPETVTGTHFNLGDEVCGPDKLLEMLEVKLGIGHPPLLPAVRTAQYLARITSIDDGEKFFSQSLKTDPWATSLSVLRRRDEIVAAGWDGGCGNLEQFKLLSLHNLELCDRTKLSTGHADRMQELCRALEESNSCLLKRVLLVTPLQLLPPVWQEIFCLLSSHGTELEEVILKPSAKSGDLSALQEALLTRQRRAFRGDGSFSIIESDDEIQAALVVAAWLSAPDSNNRDLTIIRGQGTSLLDEVCQDFGLPRPGGKIPSRWRGTLQVLPLAFETLWTPTDPGRLLEFLSLSDSPIPKSVSFYFKEALREQPGTGGSAWHNAWQRASDRWHEKLLLGRLTEEELNKRLASDLKEWRQWLQPERFDPLEGIPAAAAENLCLRVQNWARGKERLHRGGLFTDVVEHCEAFSQAINESQLIRLTRIQVQRILDAICASGSKGIGSGAQAAEWSPVDHPGQIWATTKALLWWGFVSDKNPVPVTFWTEQEKIYLQSIGVTLEPSDLRSKREAQSWRNGVLNASEQLILVKPRTMCAKPSPTHSLWHEIHTLLDATPKAKQGIFFQAQELLCKPSACLARRNLQTTQVREIEAPGGTRYWNLGQANIPMPTKESFTSINSLLGCPLSWLLRYGVGLHLGVLLDLPDDDRLAGNLAHSIIATLFGEKGTWEESQAALRAQQIFDSTVAAVAAPLLLPGRNLELDRLRTAIQQSVTNLVGLLNLGHLEVVGSEVTKSSPFQESIFEGTFDLLCRDQQGKLIVIDLKWTRSIAYRRKEIEEGRALQLSAYGWLASAESNGTPEAGYFMLPSGKLFFTASSPFPDDTYIKGTDLKNVWQRVSHSYKFHIQMLRSGRAVATGVLPPEQWEKESKEKEAGSLLLLDPPCKFCEFKRICNIPGDD